MPAKEGNSNGIQLWINLPKKLKQIFPSYQQINDCDLPVSDIEGGQVKTIAGGGSALRLNTDVKYLHINLNKQSKFNMDLKPTMRGIIYLMNGELTIEQDTLKADQAIFIEEQASLEVIATENSEFMLCFGEPHNEPIHQYGPYVD